MSIFFGVDGCPAERWLVVSCDSQLYFQSALLMDDIQEILDYTQEATLTLIDIPIGLKDKNSPGKRACDVAAREKLKERRSSVFSVPQRESLEYEVYEEASRKNKEICGVGLNPYTWGIMKKIASVDSVFLIIILSTNFC